MGVYWGGCAASLIMTWIMCHVKHSKETGLYKLLVALISALPLIIIAAIRYDVGKDYLYGYVPYFRYVDSGRGQGNFEWLYYMLNQIVSWLKGDYTWVFAASAFIFLVPIFLAILKDSPYPRVSVFLLVGMTYYFIFFNTMRQLMGCAILLLSLRYIEQKRLIPFLLCVAIASGFHITCLLFIPIYFIASIEFKPRTIAAVTVVFFALSGVIAPLLTNIIYRTRYIVYIGSRFDTGERGYVVLLMNIVITCFATVYYKQHDKKFRLYYILQVFALWIAAITGRVPLINRVRWMFGLPAIILIPMTLEGIKKKRTRIIIGVAIIVLYFIYASYTIGVLNSNKVLPYRTIFDR